MFGNTGLLRSTRIKNMFAIITDIQYTNTDNEIQSKWGVANVLKGLILTKQSQNFHLVMILLFTGITINSPNHVPNQHLPAQS